MISILIPTYQYNVLPLVKKVHGLINKENIDFEILVYDDHSPKQEKGNKEINQLPNALYKVLPENLGRSKIRNLLAQDAKFSWLLFLDADVMPIQDNFIIKYLKSIKKYKADIIYGGIRYTPEKPEHSQLLRWVYGNEREAKVANIRNKKPYDTFFTLNFLIKKKVFYKVQFNEDIPNLRLEDILFSYNLKENRIPIIHIDNPTYHLGIESSEIFLKKQLESAECGLFFRKRDLIDPNYVRIQRVHVLLQKYHLDSFVLKAGNLFKKFIKKNLLGSNPRLKLLDFYRLCHLIEFEKNA